MNNISQELLINSLPDRYLIIKADAPVFTLLAATDSYLEMTMQTRENLVGRPLFEVFPENPEVDEAHSAQNDLRTAIETCATTGEPNEMEIFRYDVADKNGVYRERWWKVTHTAIRDGEGIIVAVLNRPEDITEIHALRNQLQKEEAARKAHVTKVGNFFLERISVVAFLILVQFLCIGMITWGVVTADRNGNNQRKQNAKYLAEQLEEIKDRQEELKDFIQKMHETP